MAKVTAMLNYLIPLLAAFNCLNASDDEEPAEADDEFQDWCLSKDPESHLFIPRSRNVSQYRMKLDDAMCPYQGSTEMVPSRKVLTIVSTLSSPDYVNAGYVGSESQTIALDQLKTFPTWLPNYEIVFEYVNDNVS